ncbi:MAG: hypothetical protein Q9P44_03895 [Anaerolineae bacterium]|nr:hypothetical protein [Anaerolineae bacterium]
MTWRIHLTNQAIQRLHILAGQPVILSVWTKQNRVHHYDMENGTLLAEDAIPPAPNKARSSHTWQEYVGQLTGPNSAYYLPFIQTRSTDIHVTDDGKLRLYHLSDDRLFMETDGAEEEIRLVGGKRLLTLDLDRALGMFAGLDENLHLHIYQQNMRVGVFDIGLNADADLRPVVAVARGGANIVATDGRRLVVIDPSGTVLRKQELHYYVGRMSASPNGGMIVTSDMESGVIRAYKSDKLTLTHQRFAIDLVIASNQVQLLADLPPIGTAVSALVAHARGEFAFAMSGVVCMSSVEYMDEVPRPNRLF